MVSDWSALNFARVKLMVKLGPGAHTWFWSMMQPLVKAPGRWVVDQSKALVLPVLVPLLSLGRRAIREAALKWALS